MIEQIFYGCLSVERLPNGLLIPYRYSKGQLEYLSRIDDLFRSHGLCTAGVTMDFTTDAEELSFWYDAYCFCSIENSFDIYEDGAFSCRVPLTLEHHQDCVKYRRRKEGRSRITIFLPCMACARIYQLELGSYQPVPRPDKRWLALGDSITQGFYCRHTSRSYFSRLSRELGYDAVNQSAAGYYFDAGSLPQPGSLPGGWAPDYVTAAFGTNDYDRTSSREELSRAAYAFFIRGNELFPQAKRIAVSPPWRMDIPLEQYPQYSEACLAILEQAQKAGWDTVDGASLLPQDPSLFQDRVHPNEDGFAVYAGKLRQALL